jgi:hypothetical protein
MEDNNMLAEFFERTRDKVWIYWAITSGLLIADVMGWPLGLSLAIALNVIQLGHFYFETKSVTSFPVQVRLAYLILLLVIMWPPLYWLLYFVILGTSAMVLFDYCFLARFMSLMPWNCKQRYNVSLFLKTFVSRPVEGSVQIKE